MAAESVLGGAAPQNLTPDAISLLDAALAGATSATTQSVGGTTLVTGVNTAENTSSSVLLPSTAPVSATITDGTLSVAVQLPTGVGVGLTGQATAVAPTQVQNYLHGLIEAALPAASQQASVVAYRESLTNAVNSITQKMANAGVTNANVRVVQIQETQAAATAPPATINIDATGSGPNQVFALAMGGVRSGSTVNLSGVENAVVVGAGSVRVASSTPATIHGDAANQNIVGGLGNDTVLGGGGTDTLLGGGGANVFGFGTAQSNTTLGDLSFSGGDTVNFARPGITSIEQLRTIVTGATVQGGNTTYFFTDGTTITLIGVTPSTVDANLASITYNPLA